MLKLFICILCIASSKENLETILRFSGSDKAKHHEYHLVYEDLFAPMRDDGIKLLEIGVENGYSMKGWSKYFTNPEMRIFGLAFHNRNKENLTDNRIRIIHGDQSKNSTLDTLSKYGPFTVVIDDGSHVPSHQWKTFQWMWPHIIPGGYYIIEDIETSYWSITSKIYGYKFREESSFVNKIMQLVNSHVNSEFQDGYDHEDIFSITFSRNLIVLKKKMTVKNRRYKHWSKIQKC